MAGMKCAAVQPFSLAVRRHRLDVKALSAAGGRVAAGRVTTTCVIAGGPAGRRTSVTRGPGPLWLENVWLLPGKQSRTFGVDGRFLSAGWWRLGCGRRRRRSVAVVITRTTPAVFTASEAASLSGELL